MKISQHLVVIDLYLIMSVEQCYTLLGISKVYHKGDAIVWMRSERKRSLSQGRPDKKRNILTLLACNWV
jgi:hypothetical protein